MAVNAVGTAMVEIRVVASEADPPEVIASVA
jgi:hypothetical protein